MQPHVFQKYRQQHQLNQRQLAAEIGVDTGVIQRLERNIGNHNVRRVLLWCVSHNINPIDAYPPQASA